MNSHSRFPSLAKIVSAPSFFSFFFIFPPLLLLSFTFINFYFKFSLSLRNGNGNENSLRNGNRTLNPPRHHLHSATTYSFFSRATLCDMRYPQSSSIITILFGKNFKLLLSLVLIYFQSIESDLHF
jgi:magnesium-transporting ATPase (P-type)